MSDSDTTWLDNQFTQKIEACKEFSNLLRKNDIKSFQKLMKKYGFNNFLEVSMFSNFHDLYSAVKGLLNNQNKMISLLENQSTLNNRVLETIKPIVYSTIELSSTKNKIIDLEKQQKKYDNKFEKVKSELSKKITTTLQPLRDDFDEGKKIEKDINKSAKERGWAKDLYG